MDRCIECMTPLIKNVQVIAMLAREGFVDVCLRELNRPKSTKGHSLYFLTLLGSVLVNKETPSQMQTNGAALETLIRLALNESLESMARNALNMYLAMFVSRSKMVNHRFPFSEKSMKQLVSIALKKSDFELMCNLSFDAYASTLIPVAVVQARVMDMAVKEQTLQFCSTATVFLTNMFAAKPELVNAINETSLCLAVAHCLNLTSPTNPSFSAYLLVMISVVNKHDFILSKWFTPSYPEGVLQDPVHKIVEHLFPVALQDSENMAALGRFFLSFFAHPIAVEHITLEQATRCIHSFLASLSHAYTFVCQECVLTFAGAYVDCIRNYEPGFALGDDVLYEHERESEKEKEKEADQKGEKIPYDEFSGLARNVLIQLVRRYPVCFGDAVSQVHLTPKDRFIFLVQVAF